MGRIYNNVGVVSATTGTGTLTLGGAINDSYLTPVEAGVPNGTPVSYCLEEGNFDVEMGAGTYNAGALSRDTVVVSKIGATAGTSKINLASGNTRVKFVALASDIEGFGLQTVWMPADGMKAHGSSPAASGTITASNNVVYPVFNFDPTSAEYVNFSIGMPKSWDLGNLFYLPMWSAISGTGTVRWRVSSVAVSDDDPLNSALGSAVTSDDTLIAANDLHFSPMTSGQTPSGTPAANDLVNFLVSRDPANDNLTVDAGLIGVFIFYGVNARNDT